MTRTGLSKTRAPAAPAQSPGRPIPHEAIVEAILGPRSVRLQDGRQATLALAGEHRPAVGDALLVLDGDGSCWVIGVVRSLRAMKSSHDAEREVLRAEDGVEAALSLDGATLTVRNRSGVTLFTHDARTGQSRVEATGDLVVSAPRGDLDLESAGRVRVSGERIELRTQGRDGEDAATFTLRDGAASLGARELQVAAQRGVVSLADVTFAAEKVETAIRKARHVVGVVETRAGRIIERARNTYREVEELSQIRAGRLRMVAKGTWSVLSKRSTVKAEEDLSLLGERINLA